MKNFPVFLPLKGKKVVIAGGNELAARKARLVVAAEANVIIIGVSINASLHEEFADRVTLVERDIRPEDFAGATLAIIAEEDAAVQEKLAVVARDAGVLVNVVDAPQLCDFTTPSIIDRDDVVVAISTNGKAPVLGRNLRGQIEQLLPRRLGELVRFSGDWRDSVKTRLGHGAKTFWEKFFDGPVAEQVLAGDETVARESMIKLVNAPDLSDGLSSSKGKALENTNIGVVHIIGAGPGDPELLTLRAHRLLQTCDVVLYDKLVGGGILELARRDADRIFVGKSKANHTMPQEIIQEKMIALAREGKMVVRLKGGDPFVFGRGGEELDALREAGIVAYITPGITAATGCAAAAGMALTHRDYAQAVTFVTGHARTGEEPDLDWQALADFKNTIVVYMGVSTADAISQKLIDHGRADSTPVAVIENGTRANQIITRGTLGSLSETIAKAGILGPAILVIGEVAQLADVNLVNQTHFNSSVETERLTA